MKNYKIDELVKEYQFENEYKLIYRVKKYLDQYAT